MKDEKLLSAIRDHLWFITSQPYQDIGNADPNGAIKGGAIPDDLQQLIPATRDPHLGFALVGEEIEGYWEIWSLLRDEPTTEHRKDQELESEVWRTVCICLLRREELLVHKESLTDVVLELIRRTTAPPDDFIFIRALQNVRFDQALTLAGVQFRQMSIDEIASHGFNIEYSKATGLEVEEFGAAILVERGTNSEAARKRATESLEIALDELRFLASHAMCRYLGDDQINSSGRWFMLRKSDPPSRMSDWGRIKKLESYKAPDFENAPYQTALIALRQIPECNEDVQGAIRRSLRWYSRALQASDLDFQIISFCVCIESLLSTAKSQNESKQLRRMYVAVMMASESGFLNPRLVTQLFRLRGLLVHGHLIDLQVREKTHSFKYLIRELISAFIRQAHKYPQLRKRRFLTDLESSDEFKKASDLIDNPEAWWNRTSD